MTVSQILVRQALRGELPPIALPKDWPVLVDKAAIDSEFVIIGSGIRKSKFIVAGKVLAFYLT